MKFCSNCGLTISLRTPEGDNRLRHCCDHCGSIHYENPRLVVGTIPVWEDSVLLCRRAIEPRHGYWTLPAGFMENGESVGQGAMRETIEEAGANIILGPIFTMIDVIHVHQVHVFYRAELINTTFDPGIESLEVQLFKQAEIPWSDLAFRTVSMTLKHYFEDRARGVYSLHTDVIPAAMPAVSESGSASPVATARP